MGEPKDNRTRATEVSVPKAVVSRLSLYLRELQRLIRADCETISSIRLGELLGCTDAQVRKDLAYFGQFGYPGIGYRCQELAAEIRNILGTDRQWSVALVGTGNLGRALLGYRGFDQQGFRFVAAFDVDQEKIGECIEQIPIFSLDELADVAQRMDIRLAAVAVPASAAQAVANKVVQAGIEGVLNFAPVTLTLPESVKMVAVDLAIELEQLSFAVVKKSDRS